jgi:nucleotide-binding universal stress UspA family protein
MFQTILVPTDSQAPSTAAEQKALALAKLCGARCVLVYVIESIQDAGEEVEAFYDAARERALLRLEETARRFKAEGVPTETRAEVDRRWLGILRVADEVAADLIVMGSKPILQEKHPQLGTTSHQVFFATTLPLLVVRAPAEG